MKKLLFAILLTTVSSTAQIKFGDTERANFNIISDPFSSIKEEGVNIGVEIEYQCYWFYIHSGIRNFDKLKGGYTDWMTGMGVSLNYGTFDEWRYYAGGKLGFIWRGDEKYPGAGVEAGIDFQWGDVVIIGVRGSGDWREDFIFSGAKPKIQWSGEIKIGFKLN